MKIIQWDQQDLLLSIYTQPNASVNKVVGLFNDYLKIQITAPAIENKANKHLAKWLAQEFDVKLVQVSLLKGAKSRYKIFRIQAPQEIPDWVDEFK